MGGQPGPRCLAVIPLRRAPTHNYRRPQHIGCLPKLLAVRKYLPSLLGQFHSQRRQVQRQRQVDNPPQVFRLSGVPSHLLSQAREPAAIITRSRYFKRTARGTPFLSCTASWNSRHLVTSDNASKSPLEWSHGRWYQH
jgi:hypothetical protein